jgi:hypothetical protein
MLRGNNINSEAVIRRLIAEMYQIQADIDEDNESIGDRFDRNNSYGRISDEELAKLKETYRKNELISEAIDREIDALDDILDKIKKEKDKK